MRIQRLACQRLEQLNFGRLDDLQSACNVGHRGRSIRALGNRACGCVPRGTRL